MSFFSEVGAALKNVLLIQPTLERLDRLIERQDRDIAGLRDVIARVSERLVRVEVILEEARATRRERPALPKE